MLSVSGKVRAELASYHTLIQDLIVRQPTGNTVDGLLEVTKRNAGQGYVHGLEANADWQFLPQLSLFGWVSWMEGELDGYPTSAPIRRREYLSRVMPLTAQLGLRWDAPNGKLWAEAVSTLADQADKLSAADRQDTQRIPPGGTPGYGVLTLRAGWRVHQQVNLSAACENLLDKTYWVPAAAGRASGCRDSRREHGGRNARSSGGRGTGVRHRSGHWRRAGD